MLRHLPIACVLLSLVGVQALAAPDFVLHDPVQQVFGEPAGVTMRDAAQPREGTPVQLWIKIGPSFSYDNIAIYYTTDGSSPSGGFGVPSGSSTALVNFGPGPALTFVRNEPGQNGNDDWWVATLPAATRRYAQTIRYRIGVWTAGQPDPEVFATDPGDGDTTYAFTNKLAWPGAGSGEPNPSEGYPPAHFWKEEAVAGNNYINVMIDQNGSVYDVYYPSVGAVQGVSTKNEGYYDGGQDQFPPGLQPFQRGQMHLNHATVGLRPTNPSDGTGTTYWLSNINGSDYTGITQSWIGDTNVISTSQTLVADGNQVAVQQYDFAPKNIAFPTDMDGAPNRGLYIKRLVLTNNGASPIELNVYFYADWALNGGDQFDGSFTDATRGAFVGYDNTFRLAAASGEYNPTTFADYEKDVSVYLAGAMKLADRVGGAAGTPAGEFGSDTSGDQGIDWTGAKMTLAPGSSREIDIAVIGGFDDFAGATGTYDFQQAPALDVFISENMADWQSATEQYWQDWLAGGVQFTCPESAINALFKRGLLGTALHLDGKNGGIIAGMHNGAYPFVWPRDAAWAAITLARTGFVTEANEIIRFLRDVAFRDVEGWGRKGFWKQKYTTNGFTVWGAPQIDETSCFPWAVRYLYDVTGDIAVLSDNYGEVFEAGLACINDSTVDNRLRYEEAVDLVFSMNLWEDQFDVHNYSNASVIRGLEDAAAIADVLDQNVCPGGPGQCGYHTDRALFLGFAGDIRGGLDARLAWNGENTDISQVGITYPFEIYPPGHPRIELILDRINGLATDTFGNLQPLVQFGPGNGQPAEWIDMINRYWGDTYWNGGPWFLTTLWYGAYYAMRADVTPGHADIDNHKYRLDLMLGSLGPMGFGAEQIARDGTLLYAGQTDYRLQTAFPNAWESMSFLVDAIMLFLDYEPDGADNVFRIRPKLPSAWDGMSFENLRLGDHRISVTVEETPEYNAHAFTNETGNAVDFDTVVRVPADLALFGVTRNGALIAADGFDAPLGRVQVTGALETGAGAETAIRVYAGKRGDYDRNGLVELADLPAYLDVLLGFEADPIQQAIGDMNANGLTDGADVGLWAAAAIADGN